jgi:hypothetical protein
MSAPTAVKIAEFTARNAGAPYVAKAFMPLDSHRSAAPGPTAAAASTDEPLLPLVQPMVAVTTLARAILVNMEPPEKWREVPSRGALRPHLTSGSRTLKESFNAERQVFLQVIS